MVSLLMAGTLPLLSACELGYLLRQGWHQARLLSQRRPVVEVLTDPSVAPEIKKGIGLVQRVRAFGETELGLRPSEAYSTFIEIQGDVVAYVVSASRKDRLEPYLWRFPLVGRFPYKGFFVLGDARQERRLLEEGGYDAHLSGVSAFSALGWFSDPLYGSMVRMDETELVYTILHEMVHGTIFFKDRVDFNEQVATLVGWQGTLLFQERTHGSDSAETRTARDTIEDARRVASFLESARQRLHDLYALPLPPEEKLARRPDTLREIGEEARSLVAGLRTKRYGALATMTWDNASLLALWRYRYNTGKLEAEYQRLGENLKQFLEEIKAWREQGLDPEEALSGKPTP